MNIAAGGGPPVVGAEHQPSRLHAVGKQLSETRFVEGSAATPKEGDALGIGVDPHHLMPTGGEAGGMRGPEVTGTQDRDAHRQGVPSRVSFMQQAPHGTAPPLGDGW